MCSMSMWMRESLGRAPVGALALMLSVGSPTCTSTASNDGGGGGGATVDPVAPFLGVWNYDAPVTATGVDVAQIACANPDGGAGATFAIPQVGDITFVRDGVTGISGTTDQGCTWTFAVAGSTATLSPSPQACDNPVVGQFSISAWTVTSTDGARAAESITAQQGYCAFAFPDGHRTHVDPSGPDPVPPFLGAWTYAPPSATGVNVEQTTCPAVDGGTPTMTAAPVTGTLTLVRDHGDVLRGTDDAGCTYTFEAQGNTALLSPSPQPCGARSVEHWAIETADGHNEVEIVSGSSGGCHFLLANGQRGPR
jgi:hypothetical protein